MMMIRTSPLLRGRSSNGVVQHKSAPRVRFKVRGARLGAANSQRGRIIAGERCAAGYGMWATRGSLEKIMRANAKVVCVYAHQFCPEKPSHRHTRNLRQASSTAMCTIGSVKFLVLAEKRERGRLGRG